MNLRDELVAEMAAANPIRCGTCRWLATLPAQQREEFAALMTDESFTDRSFVRVIARRGGKVTPESMSKHRKGRHA